MPVISNNAEKKILLDNMKPLRRHFESAHESLNPQIDQVKILLTVFRVHWV